MNAESRTLGNRDQKLRKIFIYVTTLLCLASLPKQFLRYKTLNWICGHDLVGKSLICKKTNQDEFM